MTIDEFRTHMNRADKDGRMLWVLDADGSPHIALGMDSGRGVIICHGRKEIDMAVAIVAPSPPKEEA